MPVGTVVVPGASVAVTRNVDFDFVSGGSVEPAYRISKPVGTASCPLHYFSPTNLFRSMQTWSCIMRFVDVDALLAYYINTDKLDQLQKALTMAKPAKSDVKILAGTVNASADRFAFVFLRFPYSSFPPKFLLFARKTYFFSRP